MLEKHILLEDIDPVVFYGVGNSHLQMIKALYPKLPIMARDNVLKVIGDEEQTAIFEEHVENMRKHVLRYNRITEEDILDINHGQKTKEDAVKGAVVYSLSKTGGMLSREKPNWFMSLQILITMWRKCIGAYLILCQGQLFF